MNRHESDAGLFRIAYDPDTGHFTWLHPASRRVSVGDTAGWLNDSGYVLVSLEGHKHRAHRLAWRLAYGYWPAHQIDHINGARSDNRLVNLREATDAQNRQNMAKRADNKSGYVGVYYAPWAKAWRAEIRVDGQRKRLGYFADPITAHTAYAQAKKQMHTFHSEVPQR